MNANDHFNHASLNLVSGVLAFVSDPRAANAWPDGAQRHAVSMSSVVSILTAGPDKLTDFFKQVQGDDQHLGGDVAARAAGRWLRVSADERATIHATLVRDLAHLGLSGNASHRC